MARLAPKPDAVEAGFDVHRRALGQRTASRFLQSSVGQDDAQSASTRPLLRQTQRLVRPTAIFLSGISKPGVTTRTMRAVAAAENAGYKVHPQLKPDIREKKQG